MKSYRLFIFAGDHIERVVELVAESDRDVINDVRQSHPSDTVEIWELARLVAPISLGVVLKHKAATSARTE